MKECAEYARLEGTVNAVLQKLSELTTAARGAFKKPDHSEFSRIDREIESTIGEKERAYGALRQHAKDHKCQPS